MRKKLLALRYSEKQNDLEQAALDLLEKQTDGDINTVILSFISTQKDLASVLLTSSYGIRPIVESDLHKVMKEKRKQERKEFVNEKTPLLIAPMV